MNPDCLELCEKMCHVEDLLKASESDEFKAVALQIYAALSAVCKAEMRRRYPDSLCTFDRAGIAQGANP